MHEYTTTTEKAVWQWYMLQNYREKLLFTERQDLVMQRWPLLFETILVMVGLGIGRCALKVEWKPMTALPLAGLTHSLVWQYFYNPLVHTVDSGHLACSGLVRTIRKAYCIGEPDASARQVPMLSSRNEVPLVIRSCFVWGRSWERVCKKLTIYLGDQSPLHFLKKSLPLSSTTTNAGKSSTSIFHTASIPSSGNSSTSTYGHSTNERYLRLGNYYVSKRQAPTFLMLFWAKMAAGPPMEPR